MLTVPLRIAIVLLAVTIDAHSAPGQVSLTNLALTTAVGPDAGLPAGGLSGTTAFYANPPVSPIPVSNQYNINTEYPSFDDTGEPTTGYASIGSGVEYSQDGSGDLTLSLGSSTLSDPAYAYFGGTTIPPIVGEIYSPHLGGTNNTPLSQVTLISVQSPTAYAVSGSSSSSYSTFNVGIYEVGGSPASEVSVIFDDSQTGDYDQGDYVTLGFGGESGVFGNLSQGSYGSPSGVLQPGVYELDWDMIVSGAGGNDLNFTFSPETPIPESSLGMILVGLPALVLRRGRKRSYASSAPAELNTAQTANSRCSA